MLIEPQEQYGTPDARQQLFRQLQSFESECRSILKLETTEFLKVVPGKFVTHQADGGLNRPHTHNCSQQMNLPAYVSSAPRQVPNIACT